MLDTVHLQRTSSKQVEQGVFLCGALVCVGGCRGFVVAGHTKGSCTVSCLISDRRG